MERNGETMSKFNINAKYFPKDDKCHSFVMLGVGASSPVHFTFNLFEHTPGGMAELLAEFKAAVAVLETAVLENPLTQEVSE